MQQSKGAMTDPEPLAKLGIEAHYCFDAARSSDRVGEAILKSLFS
jgi:hypothetical protein